METPSITVVLPNFNHGQYVGSALRAILEQSVRPAEIIVIDDGSTDRSARVIEEIARSEPTVRFLRNEQNRGVLHSFSRGLALCRTDFVYPAAADDQVLPGFFERLAPWLERHPKAGLFLTDFAFRVPETGRLYPKHLRLADQPTYLPGDRLVSRLRRAGYILPGYGCVFRREALLEAGGFQPALRWHADWFAELVLAFRYGCCYLPEPLASTRVLEGSHSSGARVWKLQRHVLARLLELLRSPEYGDVADAFHASGALAYFGLGVARAAAASRDWSTFQRLPFREIVWREAKNLMIRVGSSRLRQRFWTVSYRRQAPGTPTVPDRA